MLDYHAERELETRDRCALTKYGKVNLYLLAPGSAAKGFWLDWSEC